MSETPKPYFTLSINGKPKKIKSDEDFQKFIAKEIDGWQWLQSIPFNGFGHELFAFLFQHRIQEIINQQRGGNETASINEDYFYVTSDSKEAALINKIRETHGDNCAAFALYFISDTKGKLITVSHQTQLALTQPHHARDRGLAAHIVFNNEVSPLLQKNSANAFISDQCDDFTETVENSRKIIETQEADLQNSIFEIIEKQKEDTKKQARAFKRRIKTYKSVASKIKSNTELSLQAAHADLASAKAAYHEQVDFDASVQYWKDRKTSHLRYRYGWLLAVILSMGLTFASLVGYYHFGAASGIGGKTVAYVASQETTTPPHNQEKTPPQEESLLAPIQSSPSAISAAIADITGAMLLITLLAVIIRITLRQFNVHSHHMMDAEERVTLTKTYLALLNEGKLKSDEDRRLILESLFRTSQLGVSGDASFSSPIELIVKSISQNGKPSS